MAVHKDFMGKELDVGDTVVFIVPHDRELIKGTVVQFIDRHAEITYIRPQSNTPSSIKLTGEHLVKV